MSGPTISDVLAELREVKAMLKQSPTVSRRMTTKQVAEWKGVSTRTVRDWVSKGLRCKRAGRNGELQFSREDVERWIR